MALAALNGGEDFYDRLMTALKNPKSPEEYYMYLFTLPQFSDPKLLQRTLDYAISPDVRSQDALGVVTSVMGNPDGRETGVGLRSGALGCGAESWRTFCQRPGRGFDQFFLRCSHARSGRGVLRRAQDRSGGAHLPAIDRAHQQLCRSEIAAGTATGVVAGTARLFA